MDHVVYLDAKAKEMELVLSGKKKMIIRGTTGRKLPHGRVASGDILYFINNNAEGEVKAKATVVAAFHSEKMDKATSEKLVRKNQTKLQLTPQQANRWAGKRYLSLIEITKAQSIKSFAIDRSQYGTMDDWLLVEKIENAKK